jgi:aminopeptidase N
VGAAADQRSSTHPVAADAAKDAASSLADFDGISYAKGAAVLKQLVAYLGDDVFLAGVRAHISRNEFGNATFFDLRDAWTEAGAVGLEEWADNWLRTAGVDTISARRTSTGLSLHRATPAAYPADRPHKLTVGGYDENGRGVSVPVLLDAEQVDVELGQDVVVVVPDADDDTWAKVRLDEESLRRLPDVLPRIESGVTRAVIWNSIRDATADADLDPRTGFEVLLAALPHETSDIAVTSLLGWAKGSVLGRYLPYEPYRGRLAEVVRSRLDSVPAGTSLQLAIARGVVGTTDDVTLLQGWLDGTGVPDGLAVDTDLRWLIHLQLARLGAIGDPEIDAELARDSSSEGNVHAIRCRAALPTPAAKERAWTQISSDAEIANYELYAACEGFWHPSQLDLTAPYVDRYFAEIAGTGKFRSGWVVSWSAQLAFPDVVVDQRVVAWRTR